MLLFRVLRHKNYTAALICTKNETDHTAIQTNRQTGNQRYSKAIAEQKCIVQCVVYGMHSALCSMRYAVCMVHCKLCILHCSMHYAWCSVLGAECIVQCYIVEQVRFLVADLLNSSHPRQLQSTSTFGVCMRRIIFMENKEECIKEAGNCCQLSVLTLI